MTTNESGDPILRLLAQLPLAPPPRSIDEQVRSRCYIALAKRNTLPPQRSRSARIAAGVLNATLALAAGVYAAAVAVEVIRLAGIL